MRKSCPWRCMGWEMPWMGPWSSMTRMAHSVSSLCDAADDVLAPTWNTLSDRGMASKFPDMTSPRAGLDQFTHINEPPLMDHLRCVWLSSHSGLNVSV